MSVDDGPVMFAMGECYGCGATFAFNPHRVPSIPIMPNGHIAHGGVRQPICRNCATRANEARKASNLPLWDTSDAAYGPTADVSD